MSVTPSSRSSAARLLLTVGWVVPLGTRDGGKAPQLDRANEQSYELQPIHTIPQANRLYALWSPTAADTGGAIPIGCPHRTTADDPQCSRRWTIPRGNRALREGYSGGMGPREGTAEILRRQTAHLHERRTVLDAALLLRKLKMA